MSTGQTIARSRDVIVFYKGDTFPVEASPSLLASGWVGGQGVTWASGPPGKFVVGPSTGRYGGFMLWGSDESSDMHTALTRNQLRYNFGVLAYGGWIISTSTYERHTYASRLGGPLVPLTYNPQAALYFSLRGYWTIEDELTLSGSILAPALPAGRVAAPPKQSNHYFLGVQTTL